MVLRLFADILDYPTPGTARAARECQELLSAVNAEAAALMAEFCASLKRTSPSRLEEVYTSTFDLGTSCHLYVGFHLLGERYERSIFLLELKERYRSSGFTTSDNDLPDRLSTMLRFLSATPDEASSREIIQEGVLPALDKMLAAGADEAALPKDEDTLCPAGPVGAGLVPALGDHEGRPYNTPDQPRFPSSPLRGDDTEVPARRKASAYPSVLKALRVFLKSIVPAPSGDPVASYQGGNANG